MIMVQSTFQLNSDNKESVMNLMKKMGTVQRRQTVQWKRSSCDVNRFPQANRDGATETIDVSSQKKKTTVQ